MSGSINRSTWALEIVLPYPLREPSQISISCTNQEGMMAGGVRFAHHHDEKSLCLTSTCT